MINENQRRPVLSITDKGKIFIPVNLDFDQTCVKDGRFPDFGEDNEHCVEVLCKWTSEYNVGLILHTSRGSNDKIEKVLNWFEKRGIPLYSVGCNPAQGWTDSNKSYGFFIDDLCVGIPLIYEDNMRPRVDWKKLDEIFTPELESLNEVIRQDEEFERQLRRPIEYIDVKNGEIKLYFAD